MLAIELATEEEDGEEELRRPGGRPSRTASRCFKCLVLLASGLAILVASLSWYLIPLSATVPAAEYLHCGDLAADSAPLDSGGETQSVRRRLLEAEAIAKAKALVANMSDAERSQFIGGVGWTGYQVKPGYFVGSVLGVPRLGLPGINMQDGGQVVAARSGRRQRCHNPRLPLQLQHLTS